MNSIRAFFALPACGLLFGLLIGCSAIMAPRDDVERCDNSGDCEPTGDPRYDSVCIKDDPDIPGVCVSSFKEDQSCDEERFSSDMTHPLTVAFAEYGSAVRYDSRCAEDEFKGGKGCPAPCNAGLTVNEYGFCDDAMSPHPAVAASTDLVGQDIRDQFCRSFFCDDAFVCDRSNPSNPTCKPCVDGAPIGEGGCADLYIANERSCIYQTEDQLDSMCAAPDGTTADTSFGVCM